MKPIFFFVSTIFAIIIVLILLNKLASQPAQSSPLRLDE